MPRQIGRLAAAGYVRVGPERQRRYRAPDGTEVSYRQAFQSVRGESFEQASRIRGKFRQDYRLADQLRNAAREGLLTDMKLATREQQDRIAKSSLKGLWNQRSDPRSDYSKIALNRLHADIKRREGESVYDYLKRRDGDAAQRLIGPDSPKARLLVALGRRQPDADYSVGDTP